MRSRTRPRTPGDTLSVTVPALRVPVVINLTGSPSGAGVSPRDVGVEGDDVAGVAGRPNDRAASDLWSAVSLRSVQPAKGVGCPWSSQGCSLGYDVVRSWRPGPSRTLMKACHAGAGHTQALLEPQLDGDVLASQRFEGAQTEGIGARAVPFSDPSSQACSQKSGVKPPALQGRALRGAPPVARSAAESCPRLGRPPGAQHTPQRSAAPVRLRARFVRAV